MLDAMLAIDPALADGWVLHAISPGVSHVDAVYTNPAHPARVHVRIVHPTDGRAALARSRTARFHVTVAANGGDEQAGNTVLAAVAARVRRHEMRWSWG